MNAAEGELTRFVHEDVLQRDVMIAELTRSQRRLQQLYDIGKLLSRFQTIDQTVPELVALLVQTLPLRSLIFVQTKGSVRTLVFQLPSEDRTRLSEAKRHVRTTYAYLVPSEVDLECDQAEPLDLPEPPVVAEGAARQSYVLLPLVVSRGDIFGVLQVQGVQAMEELDLSFVGAVVDQLATALQRNATDRALRASEAKFAGIVSMTADAVISVDQDTRIEIYNESAERIFGWSRAEVLGRHVEMLLPTRFAAAHRGLVRGFLEAAETSREMGARGTGILARRKNGEEFPADAAITKLRVDGTWLFTVTLRDITEQRRIARERAFLAEMSAVLSGSLDRDQTLGSIARLLMRELADFCVIEFVDEQGELRRLDVFVSDPDKAEAAQALKLYALDRARPHLSAVILQEKRPQLIAEVCAETLRAMTQDEQHLRLIESLGLRSLMGVPLRLGDQLAGVLIVGSCRADRRYRDTDVRLLEEIGQRAAIALENSRLYRVAQHAVQVRDDVLGVVAHDLRNPLGSILMQVALLHRRGAEPERRSRKPGEVIERAASRMNRLIQDLLDVTSMDAGHLSIDCAVLPARQVLLDLLESQQPQAFSRRVALQLDPTADSIEVLADRERLLQVLENLVGNAIKFTASGGRISVGARAEENEVLFWVSDTGSGIADADFVHLFDRFWQSRKTRRRGAGLGLAISKGLVESHGGRIWVESKVGVGSKFFFTIPLAAMA